MGGGWGVEGILYVYLGGSINIPTDTVDRRSASGIYFRGIFIPE